MDALSQPVGHHLTSAGVRIVAVSIVMCLIATFLVIARLLSRHVNSSHWRPSVEDWLVVAALLFTWGSATSSIICAYNGAGIPFVDLFLKNQVDMLVTQFNAVVANQVTFALALGAVKISILLSFKRIFYVNRVFIILANCTIVLCGCWIIQGILTAFLISRPNLLYWRTPGATFHVTRLKASYISMGVIDVVFDIIIFVLPLPLISKLKMRKSTKIATMSLFSLGLLTIAAGIIRTALVIRSLLDVTFQEGTTQNLIWSVIEPCVAIVVACLLVIKPLLKYTREKFSTVVSSFYPTQSVKQGTGGGAMSLERLKKSKGSTQAGSRDFEESEIVLSGTIYEKNWKDTSGEFGGNSKIEE